MKTSRPMLSAPTHRARPTISLRRSASAAGVRAHLFEVDPDRAKPIDRSIDYFGSAGVGRTPTSAYPRDGSSCRPVGTRDGVSPALRGSRTPDALRHHPASISMRPRSGDGGGILWWVQMVRSGQLDRAASDHAIHVIERTTQHRNALVAGLLDVSRTATGRAALKIDALDLGSVIATSIEAVRRWPTPPA